MKKLTVLFTAILAVVLFSNMAYGQQKQVKIGIVEVEKIVKEMPEAIEADKIMKDLQKAYQDTLMKMQDDLVKRSENYNKQKAMMTADQQKNEEEALKNGEQMLYQYREAKYSEINEKRELYLTPIRKKVNEAIEAVAKDEQISVVLDKGNGSVLYSEEKLDITFKVIDKMKRGSK